jgi:hypothetical protein
MSAFGNLVRLVREIERLKAENRRLSRLIRKKCDWCESIWTEATCPPECPLLPMRARRFGLKPYIGPRDGSGLKPGLGSGERLVETEHGWEVEDVT